MELNDTSLNLLQWDTLPSPTLILRMDIHLLLMAGRYVARGSRVVRRRGVEEGEKEGNK